MSLNATGVPENAARPTIYRDAWLNLRPQRADHAAHGSALASASTPFFAAKYVANSKADSARARPQLEDSDNAGRDGAQGRSYGQNSPSWPQAQSMHTAIEHETGLRSWPGGARATPSVASRLTSYASPSRFQRSADTSSSAWELDELAYSEDGTRSDVLPLIRPVPNWRREKTAASPRPPQTPSAQRAQVRHLDSRRARESPKRNGNSNGNGNEHAAHSRPQPVVVLPLIDGPQSAPRLEKVPVAIPASSPALHTPKKYKETTSNKQTQSALTSKALDTPSKIKAAKVAIGHRSKSRSDKRLKVDRTDGTSYQEVALLNGADSETNDPSYTPEVHSISRARNDVDMDAGCRDFVKHMEQRHLLPLAWLRGDGFANTGHIAPPKLPPAAALTTKSVVRGIAKSIKKGGNRTRNMSSTTVVDSDSGANAALGFQVDTASSQTLPRYLLDDMGQQVTPLLRDTVLESSSLLWTPEERERRLRSLYRQQQQTSNQRPSRDLEHIF
ncbi:hypothetical protein SEPCBS119000_000057 [Sporothrix epigloea]|uniref:Uncharacterized protein n=1 Tax=Sporothrix epigloea TaxID=1892477 RepID=A0ABP0D4T6_9PEZI